MAIQDIQTKFISLVEMNQQGTIIGDDAVKTAIHLYECAKEEAEKISTKYEAGTASWEERSNAHQIRFQIHQDLRSFGVNVQY